MFHNEKRSSLDTLNQIFYRLFHKRGWGVAPTRGIGGRIYSHAEHSLKTWKGHNTLIAIYRHIKKTFRHALAAFLIPFTALFIIIFSDHPGYAAENHFYAADYASPENNTQDPVKSVPPDTKPPMLYSLNIYGGEISKNHADDFILHTNRLRLTESRLLAVTLARRLGTYKNMASLEIEGQIVKHFYDIQDHWEFNALLTARWDAFFWDEYVDTSLAFGLGPSYATEKPEIEAILDRETSQWLAYWMIELEMGLPAYPGVSFITRLHHRSDAFRIVASGGASTAPVIGLKIRF